MKETRINKFLSEAGYCSRRAADKLIEQGRVTINGEIPQMGTKINPSDTVQVDGKTIRKSTDTAVYLALNKPKGVVCTTDTRVEKNNIIDFWAITNEFFQLVVWTKTAKALYS